jgi:hypothetical protein
MRPLVSFVTRSNDAQLAGLFDSDKTLSQVFREIELDTCHREGTEFACYFDAQQVRGMVLGMYSYIDEQAGSPGGGPAFFLDDFFLERSLVEALAAAGFLGVIRMLPPHQAELEKLRSFNFGIPFDGDHSPNAVALAFVRAIFEQSEIMLEIKSIEDLVEGEIIRTLEQSFTPRHQFQFLQGIQGGPFTYAKSTHESLRLESYPEEVFLGLLAHEKFDDLHRSFQAERPNFSRSNIADAMAIVSLISQIEKYVSGESNLVPRFYWAEGSRRNKINDKLEMILRECNAWDALHYEVVHEGKPAKVCALKSWDYFVIRAIAGIDHVAGESTWRPEHPAGEFYPERKFWASDMRSTFKRLDDEDEQDIWLRRMPHVARHTWYQKRLNDVIDAAFLEAILSDYAAQNREKALSMLARNEDLYKQARDLTLATSGSTRNKLSTFTWDILVRTTHIWWAFARLRSNIIDFNNDARSVGHQLWLNLRVFHFNLPAEVEKQVVTWVEELLQFGGFAEATARDTVWREVMTAFSHTRQAADDEVVDSVAVGAVATVLLLGRDREFYKMVLDLLNRHELADHDWPLLMRMFCDAKLRRFGDWTTNLGNLSFRYESNPRPGLAAALAVANGMWASLAGSTNGPTKEQATVLWQRCKSYAKKVVNDQSAPDEEKASAWNTLLHAAVHCEPWDESQAANAARKLREFETSDAWQIIFGGTLSQYYLKRAKGNHANGVDPLPPFRLARDYLNKAAEGPWVEEIEDIRLELNDFERLLATQRQ